MKIKELLALEIDKKRSKNKELLELGLELGFLLKSVQVDSTRCIQSSNCTKYEMLCLLVINSLYPVTN